MRMLTALVAAALAAGAAGAADFTDVAQVVSATPIMERVSEPRRECSPQQPRAGGRPDNRDDDSAASGEKCRTVETTREIVRGYTVVYRYKGREGTATLPYDPGRTVRVGITAIDGTSAASAPVPRATLGRNVREVRPADSAPAPAPVPSVPAGDYTYRY